MGCVLKLCLFLLVSLTHKVLIKCEPDWGFDIVSIKTEVMTPDKVAADLRITHPSRGVYALSGFLDFKVDVTDQCHFILTTYYSQAGITFIKTPYGLPPTRLSIVINTQYKDFIMESLLNCSENAPRVDGQFTPPLKKRKMVLNDCIISNEDMPSKMKSGYYKVIFNYTNFIELSLEMFVEIYQNV